MKKRHLALLCIPLMVVLLAFLVGCQPDNGGGGADFDATQYYTKTDVQGMLPAYANQIAVPVTTSNNNYANGVAFVPEAGSFATLLEVRGDTCIGTSGVYAIYIGDGDGNKDSRFVPEKSTSTFLYYVGADRFPGTLKVWTDSTLVNGIPSIQPRLWFKTAR
jgi:hypothetical protein